ncbi:MAG: enolase C-terminal domain-like protein [Pseudomonadota bacterium]
MRITDIREAVAPIASPMRNAYIAFDTMSASVIALHTDVVREGKPVVGYGFSSNGRYAQGGILRERFLPRLHNADPATLVDADHDNLDPFAIQRTVLANEKPGGHGDRAHAAGALDMAVWDAVAKIAGKPLWRVLSERYNSKHFDTKIFVYPGGGYYYPGKELEGLRGEMTTYLDQGYKAVKMKIGGASMETDLERIDAVIDLLRGRGGASTDLAVDANGRFNMRTALRYAESLSARDLLWFEEACDPLDYQANAVVAHAYPGAMATGENLFSAVDARNLLRYGGLRPDRDWIQLDPALSYGLTHYLDLLRTVIKPMGWLRRRLIPHGGHQLALHMAAGLQLGGSESYPGVFQPYGGFADGVPIIEGYTTLPDLPGLGVEGKAELIADLRRRLG